MLSKIWIVKCGCVLFSSTRQDKEMYQTNPTQNHMGGDNWATRTPFSTILFSMHRPLPRTLLTLTHPRYQIASGSKYMYIGNSYRAVNGSFDFFYHSTECSSRSMGQG